MIATRIEALGFRSLRCVSQRLGSFHVLVGPNASGKSTFLDVLAFLGDLQRAGLEPAVFGNAALGVPLRAVDPRHLTWMRRGAAFELAVEARVPVVQAVQQKSPERYADWLLHVREALPDVDRITVTTRPEDGHRYLVVHYRSGLQAPSWLVSDGTLRFLALTLLAYLPEPTGPYLIEEPENGIHPGNEETVFQSLSSVYDAQVLLATHSPGVARLAGIDRLLCFTRDEAHGAGIVAGPAHPRLRDWSGAMDVGTLLASGVLG